MGEEDPYVGQLQAVGEPCLPGLGEEAPSCLFFLSASVAIVGQVVVPGGWQSCPRRSPQDLCPCGQLLEALWLGSQDPEWSSLYLLEQVALRGPCLSYQSVRVCLEGCHHLLQLPEALLGSSPQAASSALSSLGHVYTAIGDYPNALASHKQCVLLAKQGKEELSEARELGNMGAVYIAMGDFENAVQCHEQHLGIAKALGNKREEARAYSNLGSAYHYHRNFDKAMSYHNHVLELAQELEEKPIEMRAYAGLGHAARCMQDLERAKQYHEEQLQIAESLQDRAAKGRASSNLGERILSE